MKFEVNRIAVRDRRGVLESPLTAAVICDVHDGPWAHILPPLRGVDCILIAGDLTNRHSSRMPRQAGDFLRACAETAPTWYAIGNHELKMSHAGEWREIMVHSGAYVLDNTVAQIRKDVWLGGLSSQRKPKDNDAAARLLAEKEGFRLLLCHHPEYYQRLVQPYEIDLTLSGHAHGGQFRFFGQGLYSPGQGIFPRLTSGFYFDDRLLVSRGTGSHGPVPRLWNPCELILLTLEPKAD